MSTRHTAKVRRQNVTENSGKNSGRIKNLRPWRPGESGNPGGRPGRSPLTDAYRARLDQANPQDKHQPKRTFAECLAEVMVNRALAGDLNAAIEITDRVEGKSVARTELTGVAGEDLFPRLSREENERRIAELLEGDVGASTE